jgi:DNA-binding NtrC family response regulator
MDEDHDYWEQMVGRPEWVRSTAVKWKVQRRGTLPAAMAVVRASSIPIVICDCDEAPGIWTAMLEEFDKSAESPYLIVTSRTADERLWAEALNRGAYDVLAKPFDPMEAERVLASAWLRWQHRPSGVTVQAMRTAS